MSETSANNEPSSDSEWARETERLHRTWAQPRGLSGIAAVNHTNVGRRFVVTSFVFFVIGGLLALMMRTQLIVPDNDLLGHETFNQFFTMHGTTMMFLFGVPMVEGIAIYLIPLLIGARDLPYPRLGALGYWCYLFGGILIYSSFLIGAAPDGGWFIYPPLTGSYFSPGLNIDFWLLGITFVEISAIALSIEVVIGILRNRAPGMTLARMPLLAWYILVTMFMIVFGFPPLIMGSILFEIERAFDFPFFAPERGGDPLLWQHLFWLFGHPEVYILFLPAAGIIATVLPTFCQRPIVGYPWLVLAAVATGFISYMLWVHHMFATGIPALSLAFFSAASMLVVVPSGIQVFAWLATVWNGRLVLATPMLFALGFIVMFVLGGVTGVMVAVVPLDLQVHDTYFVVAHLHYILIGGMVLPIFAGLYYWFPFETGRMLSERLGKLSFWLIFAGLNITFFPMHILGFIGMPRRVYTYPAGLEWEVYNLIASLGAYTLAAGVLAFLINVAYSLRRGMPAKENPWNAATLEWAIMPLPTYNFRSIPEVKSRNPLWQDPETADRLRRGEYYLPHAEHDQQYTLITSIVDARPEHVSVLPQPSYAPVLTALTTGMFFVGLLFSVYELAALGVALTILVVAWWLWPSPAHRELYTTSVAPDRELPLSFRLNSGTPWTGTVLFLIIDGTLFGSLLFGFFFLWLFAPEWPPQGLTLPDPAALVAAAATMILASAVVAFAQWAVRRGRGFALMVSLVVALLLGLLTLGGWALFTFNLPFGPQEHAWTALVYTVPGYWALHVAISLLLMAGALALQLRGYIDAERYLGLRCAAWFWHYTMVVGIATVAALFLIPVLD